MEKNGTDNSLELEKKKENEIKLEKYKESMLTIINDRIQYFINKHIYVINRYERITGDFYAEDEYLVDFFFKNDLADITSFVHDDTLYAPVRYYRLIPHCSIYQLIDAYQKEMNRLSKITDGKTLEEMGIPDFYEMLKEAEKNWTLEDKKKYVDEDIKWINCYISYVDLMKTKIYEEIYSALKEGLAKINKKIIIPISNSIMGEYLMEFMKSYKLGTWELSYDYFINFNSLAVELIFDNNITVDDIYKAWVAEMQRLMYYEKSPEKMEQESICFKEKNKKWLKERKKL